jgi:hypothetical protein
MAQEAPGKGVQQRQTLDPLGLAPRKFLSMTPFSLMKRMVEEMDRFIGETLMNSGDTRSFVWCRMERCSSKDRGTNRTERLYREVTEPLEARASDRRQIPFEAASEAGTAKKS